MGEGSIDKHQSTSEKSTISVNFISVFIGFTRTRKINRETGRVKRKDRQNCGR